ncbi:MAG TPA: class IV adenylate cyclase [Patescibacteria group bacterium]
MANNYIEIELKFPLKNREKTIEVLNQQAELKADNIFQKASYYLPAHRDFLAHQYPYEWLRLRESDNKFFLTYKHFYPENVLVTDYCDEFETEVKDLNTMKKIFQVLDFKEIAVVEKRRSIWNYKEAEITVDQVEGLGDYLEAEALKHFTDPKEGKKYLMDILRELNLDLGEEELKGYPYLLLKKWGKI